MFKRLLALVFGSPIKMSPRFVPGRENVPCVAARGKFVSGAKVLAAVPSMSQPKEFTRIDLKLAGPGRSFQQTLKCRDLSWNGESHLFLAQLIIQFICCHCLVLIHVIVVQEREPSKANSVSARFASVSQGWIGYAGTHVPCLSTNWA